LVDIWKKILKLFINLRNNSFFMVCILFFIFTYIKMDELISDMKNNYQKFININYKEYNIKKKIFLNKIEYQINNYLNIICYDTNNEIPYITVDYGYNYQICPNFEEIINILLFLDNNYYIKKKTIFEDHLCIDNLKDLSLDIPHSYYEIPIKLCYYCIAYYGLSWYEMVFNAEMREKDKYQEYKKSLYILTDKNEKANLTFDKFLILIENDEQNYIEYIGDKYERADTFRDFFNLFPLEDRYKYMRKWINKFICHLLKKTYNRNMYDKWEINIDNIPSENIYRKEIHEIQKTFRIYNYHYHMII